MRITTTWPVSIPLDNPVRWLIPGHSLRVEGRILPLADCQIRLQPLPRLGRDREDAIPTVEFWYRYPVCGAIPYGINPAGNPMLLQPITHIPEPTGQWLWLVQYSGELAVLIQAVLLQAVAPPMPVLSARSVYDDFHLALQQEQLMAHIPIGAGTDRGGGRINPD